jgi:hypothetical protein
VGQKKKQFNNFAKRKQICAELVAEEQTNEVAVRGMY